MRIKRLALAGASALLIVCLGLYHILDKTLSEQKYLIKKPTTYTSQFLNDLREYKNYTDKNRNYVTSFDTRGIVEEFQKCFVPKSDPSVDVQMGRVYDQLKFDNIDGGVWKQGWNVKYNNNQWTPDHKLKVFVVPHSHNDPGWKKTFENYYTSQTRSILNHMVSKLLEDSRRKFIWAEISFFSLWWSEASQDAKDKVKLLLSRGQLEFVTGGWVMPDEATSHYSSVLEQLTHGHQWLLQHLNYRPNHSWSIDPFGLSPTLPFILKKCGFDSLVVQRTHYSVKKYLARNKQLEFRWRQLWDGEGTTELLTHMMPFYSYDIPHTCGPDPKVCCQFDFKRLPGYGVYCPWKVPPKVITEKNVAHRAELILDQYKKKAQLYDSNVLLVPLGDDFRYDHFTEWDAQYNNYQKLFDYINSNPDMNTKIQFGTLTDYFEELSKEKPSTDFPTLSGDFFTYADRDNDYWSGYYSSRPFYKRMDRVLISYLRSAEFLTWEVLRKNKYAEGPIKLLEYLKEELYDARSHHSLFQHHDGITGTAKDHVVQDYAKKMLEAIKKCQNVIQMVSYYLLSNGKIPESNTKYFILDGHEKLYYGRHKEQTILTFPSGVQARLVTFYNPLTFTRNEIVTLRVENRLVQVRDNNGNVVAHQISPMCDLMDDLIKCYQLSFVVSIQPLSLVTYSVEPSDDENEAHVNIRLLNPSLAYKFDDWENKEIVTGKDFTLQNNDLSAAFTKDGFLKAVTLKQETNVVTIPVHLSFVKYSTPFGPGHSGAYLFLPDSEGETIKSTTARVIIVEGRLISQVIVEMPKHVHVVTLYNSQGIDSKGIEIHNLVNIEGINANYELAMRLSTNINNQDVFYTDLNGVQIIKRKRLNRLPLQGNYYPIPSCAYIEDNNTRMTLLSAQPLGFGSLSEGQIEVMQDRRLLQDDYRGLDQPVMDNRPTLTIFRLHLETKVPNCKKAETNKIWGSLSDTSHSSLMTILHPLHSLAWTQTDTTLAGEDDLNKRPKYDPGLPIPSNIHLVSAHILQNMSTGIVIHSTSFDSCFSTLQDSPDILLNLGALFNVKNTDKIYGSSLTFNKLMEEISSHNIHICENDIKAFFIPNNLNQYNINLITN
ncbi:alpha-mannosidase 2-like isoform X1 [Rhodnius prolixus]|uniref:alpha-mannosidase 2-like isoform X1 n=1 Tax=Rhodnius prolixus TaxID=13249 RepID=UPI003D18DA4B